MLDTRRNAPVVQGPDEFPNRISVPLKPSFGLGSLRSRKKLLGGSAILFLVIGLIYVVYRPATYTASSQLLIYIKQILTGADLAVLPGRADLPLVQNQIELLRSGNVLTQVVDALQLDKDPEFFGDQGVASKPQKGNPTDPPPQAGEGGAAYSAALEILSRKLRVRQVGTSHMITVSLKASDPEKTARVVNSVIRIYLQELVRASDAASSKAPTLRELYQSLGPSARVISEAEPPIRADGPPAVLILIAAALFGLSIAAVIAILLDATNDTIRSAQQMEYVLGLECLGIIRRRTDIDIVTQHIATQLPYSAERQALRCVAATMLDRSLHGLRTIGVTSTLPGEGATTVAIVLAQAVATLGKRVLLIDDVSENPSVSRWVADLPRIPHRSNGEPLFKALDSLVEVQTGLHVLPLARPSEGGAHSMSAGRLDKILNSATDAYDLVIVDMPSLVAGPDVRAAVQVLDGFLLVVKWGATESELVQQGFQSAGEARLRFVGGVLNMADEEKMKHYGYELPEKLRTAKAS